VHAVTMGERKRASAIIGWVIAALLIGFAPLFHAVCIAPLVPNSPDSGMVHVMADGTVMASGSAMTDHVSADAAGSPPGLTVTGSRDGLSEPTATAAVPSSDLLPSVGGIGVILIAAGLAALMMIVFARRREPAPSFDRPPPMVSRAHSRPAVPAWPRMRVDLDALGISRT
jgi:hypothetical protein